MRIREEHLIVYGQELHVHHIDYNKQNYNLFNLIALCHECHSRVNFNREYWKDYFRRKLMAKICLECGASNTDDLELCKSCGKAIRKEDIYQQPIVESDPRLREEFNG